MSGDETDPSETTVSDTADRESDISALNSVTPVFQTSSSLLADASAAAEASDVADWLDYLAKLYDRRAEEARQLVTFLDGEPVAEEEESADVADRPAFAALATATQEEPALLLEAALSVENSVIEQLQANLADPDISVDTKTFFQLILPEIRDTRDSLAGALAGDDAPEESSEADVDDSIAPDLPDTANQEETGETDEEDPAEDSEDDEELSGTA